MLDHLSRGGHFDLLPKVWEKIDDIEYMTDDVKPLIQRCVTRGDYASAIKLIQCSTKKTSSKKESYHFYIERKLFNMLRYSEKVKAVDVLKLVILLLLNVVSRQILLWLL